MTAALSGVQAATVLGCGGSSGDSSDPGSSAAPRDPGPWIPSALYFLADSQGSVDLSQSLPVGVVRGGTFQLAPGSSPLPPNLTLSPNGMLRAAMPAIGSTANIIFTYAEPA